MVKRYKSNNRKSWFPSDQLRNTRRGCCALRF